MASCKARRNGFKVGGGRNNGLKSPMRESAVLTGSCADFNLANAVKLFLQYSAEIYTRE